MATRPQTRPRQAPGTQSRPALRVVKGSKRKWSPVPIVVLVVLTVFGVAVMQASLGQNGLKAAKLERAVQEESERLTLLRAKTAQLSNAARVADEGDKLGLVGDPDPVHLTVPMRSAPERSHASAGFPAPARLRSEIP